MGIDERSAAALIYLLASKVNGKKADLPSDIQLSPVFSLAVKHGVGALCASALMDIGRCTEKMKKHRATAILKIMLLDAERAAIGEELNKRGIAYLPLKGALLKELYPAIGDREMSDNDILIEPSKRKEVKKLFLERGYSVKVYGGPHDDVYLKLPAYNFEMHVSLFSKLDNREFSEYFKSALKNSLVNKGNERKMTTEYFYLYMTAHEYKHYHHAGTGIRTLLDAYVFLRANPNIDREVLSPELDALGLSEYERKRKALAFKLFSGDFARELMLGNATLSEEEAEMLSFYLGSGTYGTYTKLAENQIKKSGGSVGGYIRRRLFPPLEWYEECAPLVYKHKILIPFYLLKRAFVKVVLSPKKVIKEIKTIRKAKKENKNGISR